MDWEEGKKYEKKDFRKLYEELVKSDWFKKAYNNKSLGECPLDFPELKENEDEGTRKRLINICNEWLSGGWSARPCLNDIKWLKNLLEKQKEPHYTKRNALFDKCVENCDPKVMEEVSNEVDKMLRKEQKSAEKQDYSGLNDLERAIHRGFLCAGVENVPVEIIKETAQECLARMKPAEWNKEEEIMLARCVAAIPICGDEIMPASYLDKLRTWLKSLPERFNLQPKEEWNEEDEKMLERAIHIIAEYSDINEKESEIVQNWLKSLRPQPHWKPSEEQMMALNALNCHGDLSYIGQQSQLISLYNDLKKLI